MYFVLTLHSRDNNWRDRGRPPRHSLLTSLPGTRKPAPHGVRKEGRPRTRGASRVGVVMDGLRAQLEETEVLEVIRVVVVVVVAVGLAVAAAAVAVEEGGGHETARRPGCVCFRGMEAAQICGNT